MLFRSVAVEAVPETPPGDGGIGLQPEPAPVEVVSAPGPTVTDDHRTIAAAINAAGLDFDDFSAWAAANGYTWGGNLDALHDVPRRDAAKLARAINDVVAKIKAGKGVA